MKSFFPEQKIKLLHFTKNEESLILDSFFGMSCAKDDAFPESEGLFFLDADTGRYEGKKWMFIVINEGDTEVSYRMRTADGLFEVATDFTLDLDTGVYSRRDTLKNLDDKPHTVYACLARAVLHCDDLELYGQSSGWCRENEGNWRDVAAGTIELENSMGRSTENCTPFACLRSKSTGDMAAVHVLPVGDWVIRVKKLMGHRTAYTVLEAGLSDNGLRMVINSGEELVLPELLLYGFKDKIENGMEALHRYLLYRYPQARCADFVYNTWFLGYDVIDEELLRKQVPVAKEIGCRHFVVDAGWFGDGVDWDNQVGDWHESQHNAFKGKMGEFADFVRSHGMGFGLWMDPERAAEKSTVYRVHPEWFMEADVPIYDMANPTVADYLYSEITKLVEIYDLSWMKIDCNVRMHRDHTGSNFYRYYLAWNEVMERVRAACPQCIFEGCASGGMRTDIENTLVRYNGHFISDSVNPLEVLRMRQSAALRMLPSYLGSWLVAHQMDFPVDSYFEHNKATRQKLFACADAWWSRVVDVSVDFAMKALVMGIGGIGGDITTFDERTKACVRYWIAFYHSHQDFLSRCCCRNLTKTAGIDDTTGWLLMQYTNVENGGILLYAFRLQSGMPEFLCCPGNLREGVRYMVSTDGGTVDSLGAETIARDGIMIHCPNMFSAKVIELKPQ